MRKGEFVGKTSNVAITSHDDLGLHESNYVLGVGPCLINELNPSPLDFHAGDSKIYQNHDDPKTAAAQSRCRPFTSS